MIRNELFQHRLKAGDFPFRAMGGNVLLRRVRMDSPLLLVQDRQDGPLQVGEVIGLGGRWTQSREWWPPIPQQDRRRAQELERDGLERVGMARSQLSAWKPMWKHPDSSTKRAPAASFTPMHESLLSQLAVGALVVFVNARVYETFIWENEEILVYPGCWLYGVVENWQESAVGRRYEQSPL